MTGTPSKLATLSLSQLEHWITHTKTQVQIGRLPNYIPLLATADPQWLALQVQTIEGNDYAVGDAAQPFALMSVVKPFLLLFLLHQLGHEAVFARVGIDPSEQPFHSLAQLKSDQGFPRNPMINSGAIALTALLPGQSGAERCETLRRWLNQQSGAQLVLDAPMLASVRSLNNEANRAIATYLVQSGYLDSVETAIDTYNHICCLSGTVGDLVRLGMLLATSASPHSRTINALMLTCGLYEASGRFAVRIGLPCKSGVSGALLAVVPGAGAIACYSPTLDTTGNSIAGLYVVEQMARSLNLSVFSS
ncbi:glutaminase A [Leptolyngbya sp. FACHB-36]|uniref:glutaminase A n=1 Tax=Leptolyngbya sp. FACHB-36 TaxID=2692808 RepID=UPI00167FE6F3|nr:glutaminase A [Leptolyngbya sp. FACHB-36]MBD2021616.1 glutaminase A [Leptolyngbya sp. FACHB-36]